MYVNNEQCISQDCCYSEMDKEIMIAKLKPRETKLENLVSRGFLFHLSK